MHYGLLDASFYPFTNGTVLGRNRHFIESDQTVTKLQALIIDEHPSVRIALAKRLTNTDQIQVRATARNMAEAIEIARVEKPDVVILGVGVLDEDRDTSEIAQMVEAISAWGAALLILTSYSTDDDRKAVLKAGARRYLLKDIDTDRLITEIRGSVTESFSYAKRSYSTGTIPDKDLPGAL